MITLRDTTGCGEKEGDIYIVQQGQRSREGALGLCDLGQVLGGKAGGILLPRYLSYSSESSSSSLEEIVTA